MFISSLYIFYIMIIIITLFRELFIDNSNNYIYENSNYNIFDRYIYLSNNNVYKNKLKYIPRNSCGLGNKLLGLISSIAYGIYHSYALKVMRWDSLWWYFSFPLKLDKNNYIFNVTFIGHFYFVINSIKHFSIRKYFLQNGVIEYNDDANIMVNQLAYKISSKFLMISKFIESEIHYKYKYSTDIGIHLRTGKADGKEYKLHYLRYTDIMNILNYTKTIQRNNTIYISSDSFSVKYLYKNLIGNTFSINSSACNSGYGLLQKRNKCATEAIIDYYFLSRTKYLILTRCSSFSLVSLFANKIGFKMKRKYKYFGNCKLHPDIFI